MQGLWPLPWWAAGSYAGSLRQRLLNLRRDPRPQVIHALTAPLARALAGAEAGTLLVPIPSWKRRGNPLPDLIGSALSRHLGLPVVPLLSRTRPVLGQHHLGRSMRLANQHGAFRSRKAAASVRDRSVLILDDILTSGATARSAAGSLEQAGWQVEGVVCLARTPAGQTRAKGPKGGGIEGSDLRSGSRHGDGPG
jgi:predicted amidophosphoribosyltransferase